MLVWLFALFVIVPVIEISLFILLGNTIGPLWTIGIIVLTAALGSTLATRAWRRSWGELMQVFREMREPTRPLINTLIVGGAGLLLVTPGFFSDVVGLTLLFKPPRALLVEWLLGRLQDRVTTFTAERSGAAAFSQTWSTTSPPDGATIERVEVIDITDVN